MTFLSDLLHCNRIVSSTEYNLPTYVFHSYIVLCIAFLLISILVQNAIDFDVKNNDAKDWIS